MRWPWPRRVAHRGGGALAPENTLAAIRAGASHGYRAVEFDVMLLRDGVPVLIHDETLGRTTSGAGAVAEHSRAEIAALDAGSWFGPQFAGERVPEYQEAAALCIELGLWANVEIKPARGHERETGTAVAAASLQLWRDRAPLPLPLLSSFSEEALAAAREAAPALPRGLLVGAIPPDWRVRVQRLDCVSLHCDYRELTAGAAAAVREAGCALLCYTVNDAETVRTLASWGVDAIVTDRIDRIAADETGA